MPTFIYSPGVKVLIDTLDNGIVDVTEDVTSGSLSLVENASSTFSFALLNHRRKYDGIFTPNDIVTVKMKRIKWMPVFAGYLNQVPYFSVYPRTIHLTASDTLKRLKMKVWDPGTAAVASLLTTASGRSAVTQVDGGLRDKIITVLTEVAGWDLNKIHIGQIPNDWAEKLKPLQAKLEAQIRVDPSYVGASGAIAGQNMASNGTMTVEPDGPATGALPATSGRVVVHRGTSPFDLTAPERPGPGGIGTATGPRNQWWIAMRWPYRTDISTTTAFAPNLSSAQARDAKNWWRNRNILVINPDNNKGVVLRAVDWGPVGHDSVASMGESTLKNQLGADDGAQLEFRFASSSLPLGPVAGAGAPSANGSGSTTGPGPSGGYVPGIVSPLPGPTVTGEVGVAFTSADNLQPQTNAARGFVKGNWDIRHGIGGYVYRTIAGTNTLSDHATGHAIDVMVAPLGHKAEGDQLAQGNSVAMWFAANPDVFGLKYIIWNDRKNSGNGWRTYGHPSGGGGNTLQHRDHVHLSFKSGVQTDAGPMGNGWSGSTPADFGNLIGPGQGGSVYSGLVGPDGISMLNAFMWTPQPNSFSDQLGGARALLNDTPILGSIAQLVQASQRSFMAAPNGDFIAWFPDYFGVYNTAATMIIRDIELANEGFTIAWDDERMVTHQFVAGAYTANNISQPGGTVTPNNQLNTMGIATVEFPELMEALFNVSADNPRARYFRDADAILQRFGARVNYKPMDIITGPEAEFWFAVHLFQRTWASQFSSEISLTFMPELWPGMLIQLQSFKFQAYVEQVTHTFNLGEGGGFNTQVRVIAPSTTDRSGFYGLPMGGEGADQPQKGQGAPVLGRNRARRQGRRL